jgi:PAS domain-containing protein
LTKVNLESSVEENLDELLSSYLFENIPDHCVVLDERYYIVKMNSKAEQFFLFPSEYLMSKSLWEISPQ